MTHVTLQDVYGQAYDHAAALDAREQRLTGVPCGEQDRTPRWRIAEIQYRVKALMADVQCGNRPSSASVFAAMAHLAWLEQQLQETEMGRVETGEPA